MSLRARLVLVFFFLAVLPMLGITLFSYVTTVRAFRRAAEVETTALAQDMSGRMDSLTHDLGQRLAGLSDLPFPAVAAQRAKPGDPAAQELLERFQSHMGDAAALVQSLEFVPGPPSSPGPATSAPAAPPVATGRPPAQPALPPLPTPPKPAEPGVMVIAPVPPAPGGSEATSSDKPRWVLRYMERAAAMAAREAEREARASQSGGQKEGQAQAGEAAAAIAEATRAAGEIAQTAIEAAAAHKQAGDAQARDREAARQAVRAQFREATRAAVAALRQNAEVVRRHWDFRAGHGFDYIVNREGGTVRAQIRQKEVLGNLFARTRRRQGEIPFALDPDGHLFAPDDTRARLESLPLRPARSEAPQVQRVPEDWVIVTRRDPGTGLTLGIARQVHDSLQEIRRTAARNLGYGLAMVAAALVGILPLSGRMTRDLKALSHGAERLAKGDLEARVPVRSKDELGRLAATFNHMAQDLRSHQEKLLEQERLRKELELCRRIQEEMLPHDPLRMPFAEVKGVSIPAREVSGDFFNYFLLPGGEAALLVGDVSGKGVPAALLMANLQATLRARLSLEGDLAALVAHLDAEVDANTPTTVYLTAFIGILDGTKSVMRYVNAGHNPPLLLRADGRVEALGATGRPMGLLPGGGYEQRTISFSGGDSLFLYTDGLVETENAPGEPFGIERLQEILVRERAGGLDGILADIEQAVRAHRGAAEAADDATLVMLRVGSAPALAQA